MLNDESLSFDNSNQCVTFEYVKDISCNNSVCMLNNFAYFVSLLLGRGTDV